MTTMNKRRLAGIARWLERGAKHKGYVAGFDMTDGIVLKAVKATAKESLDCGAVCCIAGAAVQFYNKPVELLERYWDQKSVLSPMERMHWGMVRDEATELLGLSADTAGELFFGSGAGVSRYEIDAKWAARVIRKLIATGEVDWAGCREVAK